MSWAGGPVSVWWPTPAVASRYFTEEELADAERYHGPLRRVGLAALVARLVLLTGAAAAAGTFVDGSQVTWRRALLGAVLTVIPLRAAAVAADAWFEYRHEPRRTGHRPVPVWSFSAVAATLTALALVAATVATWIGYRLVEATPTWPWWLALGVVAAVVAFALFERSLRGRFSDGAAPAEDDPVRARLFDLDLLAREFGLGGLRFEIRDDRRIDEANGLTADGGQGVGSLPAIGTGAGSIRGLNAFAAGLGPNRRIVVTRSLLEEPASTRDFVVAHELTHLARHHVAVQTIVSTALTALGLAGLAALAGDGRPWAWFGLDPGDPAGLPLAAVVSHVGSVVIGPLTGWLARAQERSADVGAIEAVGCPDGRSALRLHLGELADLAPPWWMRIYGHHPPPYERMEFLARYRDHPINARFRSETG